MRPRPPKFIKLENNSITTKFNALFIALILFFIAFFIYNRVTMIRYQEAYEQSLSMYYELISMKADITKSEDEIQTFLQTGNRAGLIQHNDAVRRFTLSLSKLQEQVHGAEEASYLRSMDNSFYSYQSACSYAARYYNQGNLSLSLSYYVQAERIGGYLRQYCDDFLRQSIVGNRQLFEDISNLQKLWLNATVLALSALIVMFIVSITYFHINLTKPLNELHDAALSIGRGAQGVSLRNDYSERTIRVLSLAFSTMLENIAKNMQEIKDKAAIENLLLNEELKNAEYQKLLEQANFLALQSQTNPHFMFNTLNSISRTITLGKSAEAILMIDAMAKLLRYSLSDATQPVSLREELDVVREYLKIQQYRFKERVISSILCDEALAESVLLPRLTLQPLVENAVIHGLEPKPEGGRIDVLVREEDGLCTVIVKDDGVGMPPQKCAELMLGRGSNLSIGVRNTKRRLELFTQAEKHMGIDSVAGEGTTVKIYLQVNRDAEPENTEALYVQALNS